MKKLFFFLFLLIFLFSCSKKNTDEKINIPTLKDRSKPLAWGNKQKIYVFADNTIWHYAEKKARKSLEREIYTTTNEKMFQLEKNSYDKLDDFFRFNNLLFYCNWESDDRVSGYVKEILGDQIVEKLRKDGGVILPLFNLWADDQLVLFLVGENEESLLKLNILQSEKIWDIFRNRLYRRIEVATYKNRVKPESNFAEKIWDIDLPHYYTTFKEDNANHFVSYLARSRSKPDRFLAVYYEAAAGMEISSNWLIEKRNELAEIYYEGDSFTTGDITIMKNNIAGYDGWMIRGRWQNKEQAVGGTFSSFAFYEAEKDLNFLIDNAVYYPEGEKLPALIELEVISNSLKIK